MEWLQKLSEISFARPYYLQLLYGLYVICAVVLLIIIFKKIFRPRRKRDAYFKLIGHDSVWIAMSLLIGIIIIALAGPQVNGFQMVSDSGNLDIVIAFDESFSMAANDINPSRHDVALKIIKDLLGTMAIHQGDRFTLFAFGAQSKWRMPLSDDIGEFRDKLSEIEHPKNRTYSDGNQLYTNVGIVLEHIPDSLAKQDNYFKRLSVTSSIARTSYQRVVLIFTDGDDSPRSMDRILKKYKNANIPIYAVAVGTVKGAAVRVKVVDPINPKKFNSLSVYTKLNTESLKKIATDGERGVCVIDSGNKSAASFLNAALSKNRSGLPRFVAKDNPDRFWWPLLASSLMIVMIMILVF